MTEPRFHAELDNPGAPTQWWVLDREHPGMIRAQFPLLPDDVATAEDLAQDLARQMNVSHESQVIRAEHTAVVTEWMGTLDGRSLGLLAAAIRSAGHRGLNATGRVLAGLNQ
ncbi:hypothetical protein [Deinococcus kurensis]|uniref:hypothetical protein n=1 Tax=Deinococcus kurensis TaxID=2662757 RepID=UPI0012D2DEAE|nr:hypothetical protein [Deinococcus kurensis]